MSTHTITAMYDRYEEAATAVGKIEAMGVPHADISIVGNNEGDRNSSHLTGGHTAAGDSKTTERAEDGAGTGASLGTVLGGGAGLLAGLGLLAIPGVGPVVAAGWLVATLTGAGVGAAIGGLAGSLTGAGLSEADAHTYAEGVRRGGTLVTVRADDAECTACDERAGRAWLGRYRRPRKDMAGGWLVERRCSNNARRACQRLRSRSFLFE